MYTFRKIKLPDWTKPQWYFRPNDIMDIVNHFNTICKREISAGCKEYVENAVVCPDGTIYHPHPDTPFGASVDMLSSTMGIPWVQAAVTLENQTLNDRLEVFRDPKCINLYLADNLTWFVEYEGMHVDVIDEVGRLALEFPVEQIFTYDDIRTMKWDIPGMSIKGTHYYAKVNKFDVIGPDGAMKWNTAAEAIKAGQWWVDQYNRKASQIVKYVHGKPIYGGEKSGEIGKNRNTPGRIPVI